MQNRRTPMSGKKPAIKTSKPVPKVVVMAATAGAPAATSMLDGLEDIAQKDAEGVPFILVDALRTDTRPHLETALGNREQQRWTRLQMQLSQLSLLDEEQQAPDWVPPQSAMDMERALEDELKFQADLELLGTTGSTGPQPDALLREQLDNATLVNTSPESTYAQPEPQKQQPGKRPEFKREVTFDILRKDPKPQLPNSPSPVSGPSKLGTLAARTATANAAPSKLSKLRARSTLQQKDVASAPLQDEGQGGKEPLEVPDIVNKIGDLLVQLQENEQPGPLKRSASSSYLVTITPANGSANCQLQPIAEPTSKQPSPSSSAAAPPPPAPSRLQQKSRTFLKAPRPLLRKSKQ